MFSLPENLGVVAALQRCPTPRLFAGVRLRRPQSYLFVSFFPFFPKPIGNIPTEGRKDNNKLEAAFEVCKHPRQGN